MQNAFFHFLIAVTNVRYSYRYNKCLNEKMCNSRLPSWILQNLSRKNDRPITIFRRFSRRSIFDVKRRRREKCKRRALGLFARTLVSLSASDIEMLSKKLRTIKQEPMAWKHTIRVQGKPIYQRYCLPLSLTDKPLVSDLRNKLRLPARKRILLKQNFVQILLTKLEVALFKVTN